MGGISLGTAAEEDVVLRSHPALCALGSLVLLTISPSQRGGEFCLPLFSPLHHSWWVGKIPSMNTTCFLCFYCYAWDFHRPR